MATIVTRAGKGSPLTSSELDQNQINLNTDKAELSGATFTGEITANGGIALGDNDKATFGAGDDLEIYHTATGNHSIIEEVGGGSLVVRTNGPHIEFDKGSSEYMARMLVDGAVELYYDSALKIATTATGCDISGTATISTDLNVGGAVKGNAGTRAISVGTAGSVAGGVQLWAATNQQSFLQFGDEAGTAANHYRGYLSYNHANDSMSLGTSGSTRATIDSSGSVGIGTSLPQTSTKGLHVVHDATEGTPAFPDGEVIIAQRNFNSSQGCHIGIIAGTASESAINFGDKDDSDIGNIVYNHSSNDMRFTTNTAERMRIDSSGNLLVGTSNNSQSVGIGTKIKEWGSVMVVNNSSTGGGDAFSYYSSSGGNYKFWVNANGQIAAISTSIQSLSDQRFKENIRDLDDGLSKVMQLKPRKFDWKEGKGSDIKDARGFIAQEFEKVFPDLIGEWKDPAPEGEEPYKSVSQDLIPTLVKAIQEQQTLIESLTARIAALEE